MKTAREDEVIERLLPHIAAAFNTADESMGCVLSYDREGEMVSVSGYGGRLRIDVSVFGDSPLAVINDVVRQIYRKAV